MSADNVSKRKYSVEEWPTSKVILYPTRASIVRQIENVNLKAGLNEITISDLTSTADPDSIRVSGTTDETPARINDLTVESNVKPFTANLPDSDSDSEDEADEQEPAALTAAQEVVNKISQDIEEVAERQNAAKKRLSLMEQYVSTLATTRPGGYPANPETMLNTLDAYATERKTQTRIATECQRELSNLKESLAKATTALEKEKQRNVRSNRKKVEEKEKKKAERDERRRERKETKPESLARVYRVRITIEVPSTDGDDAACDAQHPATLKLSYTTSSASWTPHYDVRLDTTNPSLSTLTYRAHFVNRTYETWSNALITLSTSQASFGGLNEKIPKMEPWIVSLRRSPRYDFDSNGLYSLAEQKIKEEVLSAQTGHVGMKAKELKDTKAVPLRDERKSGRGGSPVPPTSAPRVWAAAPSPTPAVTTRKPLSEPWGSAAPGGRPDQSDDQEDAQTLAPANNAMVHAAAISDTYGFTTTYDLPTTRTIPSSPLVRRHVIAEIPLPKLNFTYILIPKLKAAAFLKARLTNTRSDSRRVSYMGNLSFPRCSPEETVVLELGVDQAVKVEYERPTKKHSTQGMLLMGKEEVGIFNRAMRITNTKSTSVSLVVLDQVPMPEDERLRVTIMTPKGLHKEDDVARHGVGIDGRTSNAKGQSQAPVASTSHPDDRSETASVRSSVKFLPSKREVQSAPMPTPASLAPSISTWGTAQATLRKDGEVRWDINLVKGSCVSLALEWECRMPGGECVYTVS